MSTQAHAFSVEIDGIGRFVFHRRRLKHEVAIHAEYSRLTEGLAANKITPDLNAVASTIAILRVLIASAPEGWNLDDVDPLDPEWFAHLSKIYEGLRKKEADFRKKSGAPNPGGGEVSGDDGGVLVPPAISDPAD